MGRLLTDEELEIAESKGFKPFGFSWQDLVLNFLDLEKCNSIDVEQAWLAAIDEAREAQDTKTHRLVCEGLAEWWDGECPHNPSKLVARWECRRCSMLLMDALREDRVPGEEV